MTHLLLLAPHVDPDQMVSSAEAEEIRDVEARGTSAHGAATDAQAQAAEAPDAAERTTATAAAGLTGAERDLDRALALEADHEEGRRGEVTAAHASWAQDERGVRARNAVRSTCRADAAWQAGGAGALVADAAGVVLVPLARPRRG